MGIAAICVTRTELLARGGGGGGLADAMRAAAAARGVDVLFALTSEDPCAIYCNLLNISHMHMYACYVWEGYITAHEVCTLGTHTNTHAHMYICMPTAREERGLKSLVAHCSAEAGSGLEGVGLGQARLGRLQP